VRVGCKPSRLKKRDTKGGREGGGFNTNESTPQYNSLRAKKKTPSELVSSAKIASSRTGGAGILQRGVLRRTLQAYYQHSPFNRKKERFGLGRGKERKDAGTGGTVLSIGAVEPVRRTRGRASFAAASKNTVGCGGIGGVMGSGPPTSKVDK